MTNCGTSIVSVSYASPSNFDKGGVILTSGSITEVEQNQVVNELKDELTNWVAIGVDEDNAGTDCTLHCKMTPTGSDLFFEFFEDGTTLGTKIAEGTATPNVSMTTSKFNNSGITISVKWSGELPRADIDYLYVEVKIGTLEAQSREPSLKQVKTVFIKNNIVKNGTDGSDSKGTLNNPYAKSLTFGNISAGGTSDTLIAYLSVPNSVAIDNIKLGLIDAGGITFTVESFGAETSPILQDIEPEDYFQGVNSTKTANNDFNVDIENKDRYNSEYVYLNIKLPSGHPTETDVIRYKWFFDYQ
tara:strand:- start:50711 stop:51613 length:903 start_codon:yes stop_codon:yes gene_type:complete